MITMGVDLERSRTALALAQRHPEVFAGIGHLPSEAAAPDIAAMRVLAADPRAVAIGEVGLEFEEAGSPPHEVQMTRLDELLALAVETRLPVSIHNRGAATELVAAIVGHRGLRGVMHYFALEWDWAERFLELGFYLSFAGLVTRPSRRALRDVVRRCPADRLLLETDSPFGLPAARKREKQNRPAFLVDTARVVAEVRGISPAELAEIEWRNAHSLFTRLR